MILEEIVNYTKRRIELKKSKISEEELISKINDLENKKSHETFSDDFPFQEALKEDDISFICEIKRASPSKGIISDNFDYVKIAKDYEKGGASAISVLTEPRFFKGDDRYLSEISSQVKIPILMKDFVIDKYMIHEAKLLGASAVLLICSILNEKELNCYIKLSESLGLSALVETHDREEIKMAISAGAKIIGVNNRNLKDFSVDISTSIKLRKFIPNEISFVSESGINTFKDVENLRKYRIDGVLIGERLMKSPNVKLAIRTLKTGT
ncbi:MAG: indole-3-glycerol phosphate synthase TrpC [Methanobrevibacter sp.]|jgi:indole-3-glycerol phosphate synthase|nr:indole-3-glycerol phosphate synthase TrpC [Methanobrevibacter sp.]